MFVSKLHTEAKIIESVYFRHHHPKTIIVCGGAGFLGSHLCRLLLENGDKVICVDNLITGKISNIKDMLQNPDFGFVQHNVIDPLFHDGPVDQIYNLACAASPPQYQRDPIHTFKTSVLGAMNLLELAKAKGARILQASTSEIYGDPNVSPQPESYFGNVNTVGPRSCYDEGKRAAETLFHDYHECHGVVTKIARIFNTYGPKMRADDGRVVSNFIVQAIHGDDLTIFGDGKQTRSFCYRDDLLDGMIKLMNSPEKMCNPINLGNPGEFTMLELAELVIQKVGSTSKLIFNDRPVDDPQRRCPDITIAMRDLGWAPTIKLSEGLDRTIAYFLDEAESRAESFEMTS